MKNKQMKKWGKLAAALLLSGLSVDTTVFASNFKVQEDMSMSQALEIAEVLTPGPRGGPGPSGPSTGEDAGTIIVDIVLVVLGLVALAAFCILTDGACLAIVQFFLP